MFDDGECAHCERCLSHATHVPSNSSAVGINRVNTLRLRGRAMANDVLSNRYNRYMSRESATTASVLTAYSDVVIPVGQSHPA